MTTDVQFNNISLGGRGGTNPGHLRLYSGGILWKKQGGGKAIEVDKADIVGVTWMKVPKTIQVGIRIRDGLYYKFIGFRDQDITSLTNYFQTNCGLVPEEKKLSVSGRNWGEVDLSDNMLSFLVDSKQGFEVSLADVSQTQLQGKNDVTLEFHVDDTSGANEKDSLMEITFHIPNSNTQFMGDENRPPAQVFRDKIISMADVNPLGEAPIVTFESIAVLTPRGRYSVELHLSFLRLQGQANDFKIQYSSVVRIFLLPKSNQPHTFVVITLDPPIRKGQTLYPHIVLQFETEYVVESELAISDELLNGKYKDKLEPTYKGLIHDVFTKILHVLSSAKITKPGKFRSCQDGYAVKSSLKAEDGVLYPLEKSFFFLPKPPTLITHDMIDYVEFERHGAGGSNMHYFDLLIKLKSEQEHLFRNIQRNEYHTLFDFISSKGIKIMNLGDAQVTETVSTLLEEPDTVDPHLVRVINEAGDEDSDEEDEDFVLEKDDAGSPTDDSGDEGSDASESGGEKEKPAKKDPRKEPSTSNVSSSKKKSKEVDEDGPKKKKQKKKKDPKAPKSGFMFFWSMERENVKTSGRVIRDKWMKMSAEEKKPYEAKARQDKLRYKEQLVATTRAAPPQPMNVSEAELILTFNKDRSSSMQLTEKIIEVAADSGVLETPPSKKVQKESNPVSALATQTDAKTIELAADRGILKTPPPKKVQGELTAGCLPIQTDATFNSPLDGNKHKVTYEAMKINKEAKPNLTLTENHTVPAVKINEKPVQVGIGMEHSQSSKQVQKEWTCALCQVTTIREQDLHSHLQGRKHKASYDALIASNQAFVPTIAPASTAKTSDQPNKEPGKSIPSRRLKQKVTSSEPVQAQEKISRRQRRIQQWHEEGKSYTSREGTKSATEAEFPVVVL